MWSPHSPRSLRRPHATRGTTSGANAPIVTGRNTHPMPPPHPADRAGTRTNAGAARPTVGQTCLSAQRRSTLRPRGRGVRTAARAAWSSHSPQHLRRPHPAREAAHLKPARTGTDLPWGAPTSRALAALALALLVCGARRGQCAGTDHRAAPAPRTRSSRRLHLGGRGALQRLVHLGRFLRPRHPPHRTRPGEVPLGTATACSPGRRGGDALR